MMVVVALTMIGLVAATTGRVGLGGWDVADRPRVMGIVNATPDSFSDGGRALAVEDAVVLAIRLQGEGADLLDVGGESSRPGSMPVPIEEEVRRVLPAVEAIAGAVRVPISVDTTKAEVARRALAAGASIINDITGLTGDPAMPRVVAEAGALVVVMHMQGTPRTMQDDPRYGDVVLEVRDVLARRVDRLERLGISRERVAVDPGIGFGKTLEHNITLLRNLHRFVDLAGALLVGTSRKGFLGTITGRPVGERGPASAASAVAAVARGAEIVRVHDVAMTVDALKVWAMQGGTVAPDRTT